MEISRIRKGDILITEETRFGFRRLVYGPVMIIDTERGEVGIKAEDDAIRSFLPKQLSTIYDFVNNCRAGRPSPNRDGIQTLMGYIVSLAEGKTAALQEVADCLRSKGVKPVAPQEVLESLLSR